MNDTNINITSKMKFFIIVLSFIYLLLPFFMAYSIYHTFITFIIEDISNLQLIIMLTVFTISYFGLFLVISTIKNIIRFIHICKSKEVEKSYYKIAKSTFHCNSIAIFSLFLLLSPNGRIPIMMLISLILFSFQLFSNYIFKRVLYKKFVNKNQILHFCLIDSLLFIVLLQLLIFNFNFSFSFNYNPLFQEMSDSIFSFHGTTRLWNVWRLVGFLFIISFILPIIKKIVLYEYRENIYNVNFNNIILTVLFFVYSVITIINAVIYGKNCNDCNFIKIFLYLLIYHLPSFLLIISASILCIFYENQKRFIDTKSFMLKKKKIKTKDNRPNNNFKPSNDDLPPLNFNIGDTNNL